MLIFFKKVILNWLQNNVFEHAAALAYGALFSLGPTLILVIRISGFIFGERSAEGRVFLEINSLIGRDSAHTIKKMVQHLVLQRHATWATFIGLFLFLMAASAGFAQLKGALNQIWSVRAAPEVNDFISFFKNRLISLAMILVFAFFSLFFLILSASISLFGNFIFPYFHISAGALSFMNGIVSLAVVSLLLAIIYKVLPDVKLQWRDVFPGALFTAILFAAGKYLIALYILKSNIANVYGATASLVIILVWVYYSSLLLFLGASFVQVYVQEKGRKISHKKNAAWIKKEIIKDIA
ncbi:MAG: YihY/virulence factor BrkB family protein [Deltaproteobacteria bacterium]|nr:YihY/virulence factor BrkB family protein [Deltaproteobacteria bacterium]